MLATKFTASSTHAPTIAVPDKQSRNHVLRYALVVVGCCLGAAPARAEMLLAEISFTAPAPVSAPASFNFGVGNGFAGSPTFHNWIETVPSFPYTSMADAATLAEFDRLMTTGTSENGVSFGLTNGPYHPRPSTVPILYLDQAFAGTYANFGLTATRYAEPIRVPYALQWYALTSIERNVTADIQTIRIFGYPDPPPRVPEPATWLLVAYAVVLDASRYRPYLACGRHRHMCRRR